MNHTKYSDISSLLVELCNAFSDDELKILTHIGEKMSNDSTFNRLYTLEVKNRYLANIRDIKSGKYTPINFTDLNNQICTKINNNEHINVAFLPEYATFDHLDNKKDKLTADKSKLLKQRIEKLSKNKTL